MAQQTHIAIPASAFAARLAALLLLSRL